MTLRDPHTGRFIRDRAKKHMDVSYALGLLKSGIYATCFSAFLGMLAATLLFIQIVSLRKDINKYEAAIILDKSVSTMPCFSLEKPATGIMDFLDPVKEEIMEPETEKPRSLIRVIRNGKVSWE